MTQSSREWLETALEFTNTLAWEWQVSQDKIRCTPDASMLFGCDIESFEDFLAQVHPDDQRKLVQSVESVVESGSSYSIEYRVKINGDVRWLHSHGRLAISDDRPERVLGISKDITERKQAEREREGILARMTDAFMAVDQGWYLTKVNEQATEILSKVAQQNFTVSDLEGENLWEVVPDAVGTVFFDQYHEAMATQQSVYFEEYYDPLDVWFEVSAYPSPSGLSIFYRDITNRKTREQNLLRYKRAVEQSSDMLTSIDSEKNFRLANQRYCNYYEIEQESIIGKSPEEIVSQDIWDVIEPHLEQALSGESVQYRITRSRRNQADHVFDVRYDPIEVPDSESPIGVTASLRDITSLMDKERQLKVLDRVLRHNIRNAMGIVIGYAETIADGATDDVEEHAELITSRGKQLMELANKQREITKVLSKPRQVEQLKISRLIRPIYQARESHPEANIKLSAPNTLQIRTIPQIQRAIEELVDNAIQHVSDGSPEISITINELSESIEICVADNGPGIPSQERGILVGEQEITTLYHGSGLGLWLVNWIVSRANGTLQFEKNEPRGSIVKIKLPQGPPRIDRIGT